MLTPVNPLFVIYKVYSKSKEFSTQEQIPSSEEQFFPILTELSPWECLLGSVSIPQGNKYIKLNK